MTEKELTDYLKSYYPKENEACEWKEFKHLKHNVSGSKGEDLATYVSAIANMEGGAIVMGIEDETFKIVGIQELHDYTSENLPFRLLGKCLNLSSEGLSVDAYETEDTNKTVWVLHIPKHLSRRLVYAHGIAWQRSGDSLIPIRSERETAILNEPFGKTDDWSAHICAEACLSDLDSEAITLARVEYLTKNPKFIDESTEWDDQIFLNKAKLTIESKITNSTLLLLGKESSARFISPAVPQITWILKDKDGVEQGYEHFGLPLLLSARKVHAKIRNYKYRYMADSKLFPDEIDKYDPWIVYEALHNCIAHQDYESGGRINVVEFPDKLVFSNVGSFLAGNIESIIERDAPPELYRNPFLCQAMVQINMIDTIGSGIRRIYSKLRQRFFPMPNYNIELNRVEVTIFGQILDERYSKLLASNLDLSLHDVIVLDQVVKKRPISEEIFKELRQKGLIEGRKPNFYISASVATATGNKAEYTNNRAFDKKYYFDLIEKAIHQHGSMSRKEINTLLWKKLPDHMSEIQRTYKINNLVNELSNKLKRICNQGSNTSPKWVLCKDL